MRFSLALLATLFILVSTTSARANECVHSPATRTTDDYYFSASSDQGVPGDVVAVEVSFHVDSLHPSPVALVIVGCYDTDKAELLGEPDYSDVFDELFYSTHFWPAGDPPRSVSPEGKKGFIVAAEFERDAATRLLREDQSYPLMTLYFRLQGNPGDEFEIQFCDDTFVYYYSYAQGDLTNCWRNEFYYISAVEENLLSTRHAAGTVRIVDGPVTRPDPPATDALAKVYPGTVDPQSTQILFEIEGAVASPGDRDVPVGVYITSSHEFSGFSAGIQFPAEYLELAWVEEHTRPGIARIDDGTVALMMQNSRRRVGAEVERVRIATLHFNVLEAATDVQEIPVRFEPVGAFVNWVVIHSDGGILGELPVATQVAPVSIQDGMMKLVRSAFLRGDASGDGKLEIADAVSSLMHLFLSGPPPLCLDAADANDDGGLDLADPITVLEHLFRGGPPLPPPYPVAGTDATPDALGCSRS